jgi:hypothetical protein
MKVLTRGLAVAAVLSGAAVGLAGPAAAEPLSGDYAATVIDGGGRLAVGKSGPAALTPCGTDCTHLQLGPQKGSDLHLQGNNWTGTYVLTASATCTFALDNNSLVLAEDCPDIAVYPRYQLTKNG